MNDMTNSNLGSEIGLDDEILAAEDSYPTLEPGDYPFTVLTYQRKRFNGSPKMCACTIVELQLQVQDVNISHGLFLNTKMIGKLSEFFVSIGQAHYGQKFRPNWQAVPGARGMCKVGIRKWTGNDGAEHESNTIAAFYPPAAGQPWPAASNQSSAQAGWQPPAAVPQPAQAPQAAPGWQQQKMDGYASNASPWAPGKF